MYIILFYSTSLFITASPQNIPKNPNHSEVHIFYQSTTEEKSNSEPYIFSQNLNFESALAKKPKFINRV